MSKKKQSFILSLFVLSVLIFSVKGVSAASGYVKVPLTVRQMFELKNQPEDAKPAGTYLFQASDKNIPMPEGSRNGEYSFSLTGEKAETTLVISYSEAGIYHYQILQTTKDKKMYTYDRSIYQVTVYVEKGDNGKLIPQVIVEKEDGKKYGNIEFHNSCTGTVPEITVTPSPGVGGGSGNNSGGGGNFGSSSSSPVKTGDETDMSSYLYGIVISGTGIIGAVFLKKKKREQI